MTDEWFAIRDGDRQVARAQKKGGQIHVTVVVGPRAGQSLGVFGDEQAALRAVADYMKGLD